MKFTHWIIRFVVFVAIVPLFLATTNAQQETNDGKNTQNEHQSNDRNDRVTDLAISQARKFLQKQQNDRALRDQLIKDTLRYYRAAIDAKERPTKYWIGIQCEPVESVVLNLRTQEDALGLPIKSGLKILNVNADGPAAKVGVKANDVLIGFNKTQTSTVDDLLNAINENKTEKAKIYLIRNKSLVTYTVTPSEREQKTKPVGLNAKELQRIMYPQPGLEKGYSANISIKNGNQVKFEFKKGNEVFAADNDDIDKLPKEVQGLARQIAQTLTGAQKQNPWRYFDENSTQRSYTDLYGRYLIEATQFKAQNESKSQTALEKIQVQLDALQKAVNALKQK